MQAKEVVVTDQQHAEMLFFLPMDGKGHVVLWQGEDRNTQAAWVRNHVHEHYIYGVVHVCEAWVHVASSPNDQILKQVIAGEIRVSELRPEHRTEAITVTAQTRDGYSHAWFDEILRDKSDGNLRLGVCRECDDFEGRFGKPFGG